MGVTIRNTVNKQLAVFLWAHLCVLRRDFFEVELLGQWT